MMPDAEFGDSSYELAARASEREVEKEENGTKRNIDRTFERVTATIQLQITIIKVWDGESEKEYYVLLEEKKSIFHQSSHIWNRTVNLFPRNCS